MTRQTIELTPNLYQYMLAVSLHEPEICARLRQETAKLSMAQMQISPEQGQFMALLVQLINAKKTLELGVFTGYSALRVALALPSNGRVVACDTSKEWTDIAQTFWTQAGVRDKIDLRLAPAAETLQDLLQQKQQESFDFVFIDADKKNYPLYYEKSLVLLRPGGLIVIDNVLREGKVADVSANDDITQAIRNFNQTLYGDRRVDISMIPISDGLTLARKR